MEPSLYPIEVELPFQAVLFAIRVSPSLGEGGPSCFRRSEDSFQKTGMSEQLVRMSLTTLFLIGLLSFLSVASFCSLSTGDILIYNCR